jgi:hypothetical protein
MSGIADESDVAYHLLLNPQEAEIAVRALHLLIADEAHEADIRALARAVIERIQAESSVGESGSGSESKSKSGDAGVGAGESGIVGGAASTQSVALSAPEMKIAHTAVKLLLLDTRRDQETERQLLWSIVQKLPDDHAIRAIEL